MALIEPAAPKTVHVIGDSHALAFKGKSISLPRYDMTANASAEYIPGFTTDGLIPNRQLRLEIVHYFFRHGIISKEGVRAAASADPLIAEAQYATGTGFDRPMVIFVAGEIFVRNTLQALLSKGPVKLSEVHQTFRPVVEGYLGDVAAIRSKFGLHAVVHEICPPTANDARFEEANGFHCPRDVRAVVYTVFNTLLLEAAPKQHLAVCQSADYLAVDGVLADEYEFDGVHADPKYAYTSMERAVTSWLHSRGSEQTDRYISWCKRIDPAGYNPEISRIGISEIFTPFSADQLDTLRRAVDHFEELSCKKPRLDWAHQAPTPRYGVHNETITYGDITSEGLGLLREVLVQGPLGDTVRRLFGAKFSIINVRPVHSLPHEGGGVGQQGMHRDACPSGVFRALIYLSDVGVENGPFEYIPVGQTAPTQVTGRAGSAFFFDANAVTHRATPPRSGERWALDLIILVQPEGCTEVVDCRPGFTWPIDPYMFGVSDTCVPRMKADRWFYPAFVAPKLPAKTPVPDAALKRAVG